MSARGGYSGHLSQRAGLDEGPGHQGLGAGRWAPYDPLGSAAGSAQRLAQAGWGQAVGSRKSRVVMGPCPHHGRPCTPVLCARLVHRGRAGGVRFDDSSSDLAR